MMSLRYSVGPIKRESTASRPSGRSGVALSGTAPWSAAFVQLSGPLSLGRPEFHFGNETAEVLVSRAIESKHGQRASGRHGDLRANMRPHSCFLSRLVKTCRAINTIAVEQCHGWHLEFMTCVNECFGEGSSIEKAECRCGVEFDVTQS